MGYVKYFMPETGLEEIKRVIEIKKNPNGDTRTAPKGITFEQFQEADRKSVV